MSREDLATLQKLLFTLARIMNEDKTLDKMTAHSTTAVMLYVNNLIKAGI